MSMGTKRHEPTRDEIEARWKRIQQDIASMSPAEQLRTAADLLDLDGYERIAAGIAGSVAARLKRAL